MTLFQMKQLNEIMSEGRVLSRYKVALRVYGVEFLSQECEESVADMLIENLKKFGIHNTSKIEVINQ